MKKVVSSALIICGFLFIHATASAQTTTPETTTPQTGQSSATTDGADETTVSETDSVSTETPAPATSSENEKPAMRNKLYSGKQRGNNVIYDPKK